ncbi:gibberellin 2-beta-dioxygenase 8-like [Prosopis cineraria]|uniref:gibberellin 2-beta-dioxygenase 8-like n=1 Tax=Prosopis cineraria TaxID=364024 RepID=UPI002410970E|nr:gibberellin 2-beta-dioxygenase 8-like [Prosopis cineraria]
MLDGPSCPLTCHVTPLDTCQPLLPSRIKPTVLTSSPPSNHLVSPQMSHDLDSSYPPPLRHVGHREDDDEPPESITDSDPVPVPVIDLHCLNDDVDKDGEELRKLDEACREWGIFRLVNHGVPLGLMAEVEELTKRLFWMSFESKKSSCEEGPVSYFWGTPALTPSGSALSGGHRKINLVEGFNLPLSQLSEFHPQLPLLQSFRVAMIEYGEHISRIATSLFKAMASKLEVKMEEDKSSNCYVSDKTGNIRVYRYPRSPNNHHVIGSWGMEPHTDSSVLSILNHHTQDSALELFNNHQWLPLQSIPNTLVVNIGDMMQAISDDRYKSALHRVRISQEKERISVCYFVFPDEEFVIESSKYKPFSYSDFRAQVQEDIKTTGYKVGLSRFSQTHH